MYRMTLHTWSRYVERYGAAGHAYPWMSEYTALVEPYEPTTLKADCVGCGRDSEVSYSWSLDGGDPISGHREFETYFTTLREYTVTVTALKDEAPLSSFSGTLICRYVRREVRQLLDDDRAQLFDAMATLWSTNTAEGQAEYGPAFVSVYDLSSYHVRLSSDIACDHMHDGLGFMTQHIALTIMFEQALQAVEPAVALPFWDFTIDKFHYDSGNWTSLSDSPIWRVDWFGMAEGGEYETMTKGRWKYIEVESNVWDGADDDGHANNHNSYGYLRAPWNNNNRPYVTRSSSLCGVTYTSIPSCKVHWQVLQYTNTWSDFAWLLPYEPHGTVHMYVGGSTDCNNTFNSVESYISALDLPDDVEHLRQREMLLYFMRTDAFVTLKDMYRGGKLFMPSYCSLDTPFTECHGTCFDFARTELALQRGQIQYVHSYWATMFSWAGDVQYFTWLTPDVKVHLMRLICGDGVGTDGDQLESGSPMDPSFWPIHPTMERLWQFKKLSNTFTDETWPDSGYASVSGCYGHAKNSTLAFSFALKTGAESQGQEGDPTSLSALVNQTHLTNEELYSLASPTSNELPYIYGDFEWSHCKLAGWDFDLIGSDTATSGGGTDDPVSVDGGGGDADASADDFIVSLIGADDGTSSTPEWGGSSYSNSLRTSFRYEQLPDHLKPAFKEGRGWTK